MRLSPGQTIGRYVIESLLGQGGMGEVYRARDSRLERSVALKVLRNEEGEEAGEAWEHAVMRMQREAQAVAALSHPGIVAIYDIGEQDGAPFIAMELVAGKSLRELIGTELPMSTRLGILLDVARALAAAHEAGFVHRDIKPENILVRPDHSPKVLDFGIARRTTHNVEPNATKIDVHGTTIDASAVGMTADGALLGTPAYMAPEQLRGEAVDARADQFAWGVVAYELIAGKHPFHAEKGAMTLMASILSDTPEPLEGVPETITNIVRRALEKEPADRWGSMQQIVSSWPSPSIEEDARKLPTGPSQASAVSERQTHSTAIAPAARPFRRSFLVGAVIVSTVLVAVGGWYRRKAEVAPASSAMASASTSPPTTPTAVTDLLAPASNNAEARAAFREGLQSIRDARWSAAVTAFERARKADPEMAAAHLRYAVIQFSYDATSAREAFRTAYGLRAALSERDGAFLHAFEPIIQRNPSDYTTAAERFQALTERYPLDAELLFWYARSLNHMASRPEVQSRAVEVMDRCVALDPQYADCWQTKADALMIMDRVDDAITAVDACIARSDNAIDCLQQKITLEGNRGRCNAVVESTRQLTAKDSISPWPQRMYAEALYFSGAEEAKVRNAIADAVRLFRNQKLEFEAGQADAFADIGFGHLSVANQKLEPLGRTVTAPSIKTELDLLVNRVFLYAEMGRWDDGAALAKDAFQRISVEHLPTFTQAVDPTIVLNAVLLQAGKMSRKEFEAKRTDWLAKHPMTTDWDKMLLWFVAYGLPALSKDLAEDALKEAQRITKPPDLERSALRLPWSTFYGKILVTVGKYREAIPYLEIGTRMCTQVTSTLTFVQTIAALGIAREATGDTAGACQAYGNVLSRWGSSKESVTGKDITRRAKKLGCEFAAK